MPHPVAALEYEICRLVQMITKTTIRGFVSGLLAGLLFVVYRVMKHSGGPRREELNIYAGTILAVGIIGGIAGRLIDRSRTRK